MKLSPKIQSTGTRTPKYTLAIYFGKKRKHRQHNGAKKKFAKINLPQTFRISENRRGCTVFVSWTHFGSRGGKFITATPGRITITNGVAHPFVPRLGSSEGKKTEKDVCNERWESTFWKEFGPSRKWV